MSFRRASCVIAVLAASLLLPAAESAAATITIDTTYLPPGTYSLDFQLTNGDGTPNNNTATLTNFNFGGGVGLVGGYYAPSGGGTGDYSTFVTLTDTDFFNSFTWDFTAGVVPYTLSFDLSLSNFFASGTPDQFTFAILFDGFEMPTTDPAFLDPNFRNKLLVADLVGGDNPEVTQYTLTPEPGTLILLGSGLLGTIAARRRARRKPSTPSAT